MSQRNCPNCGAPYKTELSTCPYCGTSYFDMSAIDITDRKPFYLKLRTGDFVFTSLVRVAPDMSISIYSNEMSAVDHSGNVLSTFVQSKSVDIDMRFESVPDKKAELFTITMEE